MNLHRKRLKGKWHCVALISMVESMLANAVADVFTQGKFVKVCPLQARRDSGQLLVDFTDDVGAPEATSTNGAGKFTGRHKEFCKHARRMRMQLETSEQGGHDQNQEVEREIGFLSK